MLWLWLLATPMIGYAGFSDGRAWPFAMALLADLLFHSIAAATLLFWLYGESRRPSRVRTLSIMLWAMGLLSMTLWPLVIGQIPTTDDPGPADILIVLLPHTFAAGALIANGALALRELTRQPSPAV